MKIKNRLQGGFSIIELILYAGLLVLFLAVLSNLFLSSLDIKMATEGDSFAGQDARFIIARLTYDLKRADSILTPSLGTASNNLTLAIGGSSYSYRLTDKKMTLIDDTGASNLNSSETTLSSLNFQTLGNVGGKNTVKVTLTINNQTYTTTLGTR